MTRPDVEPGEVLVNITESLRFRLGDHQRLAGRLLIVGQRTEEGQHFTFLIHRIDNNEHIIERPPAFDECRDLDLAVLTRLRARRLVGILINDQVLFVIISGDIGIVAHPAVFAVDVQLVDPLFHDHRITCSNQALERFQIAPVAYDRRHARDIVHNVVLQLIRHDVLVLIHRLDSLADHIPIPVPAPVGQRHRKVGGSAVVQTAVLVLVFDSLQQNGCRQRCGRNHWFSRSTRDRRGRRNCGCGSRRRKSGLQGLHHGGNGDIKLCLLFRAEDGFVRGLDHIADLGAKGIQTPGQPAVNGRHKIKEDDKNDDGRNGPSTVKTVLHKKIIKQKDPWVFDPGVSNLFLILSLRLR